MKSHIRMSFIKPYLSCTMCGEDSTCDANICDCGGYHCNKLGKDVTIEYRSTDGFGYNPTNLQKKAVSCHFCKASIRKGERDRCYGFYKLIYKSYKSVYVKHEAGNYDQEVVLVPICSKHNREQLVRYILTTKLFGARFIEFRKISVEMMGRNSIKYREKYYNIPSDGYYYIVQCGFCNFFFNQNSPNKIKLTVKTGDYRRNMCDECYKSYCIDQKNPMFSKLYLQDIEDEKILKNEKIKEITEYTVGKQKELTKKIDSMEKELKKLKKLRSDYTKETYKTFCKEKSEAFDKDINIMFKKASKLAQYYASLKEKAPDYPSPM